MLILPRPPRCADSDQMYWVLSSLGNDEIIVWRLVHPQWLGWELNLGSLIPKPGSFLSYHPTLTSLMFNLLDGKGEVSQLFSVIIHLPMPNQSRTLPPQGSVIKMCTLKTGSSELLLQTSGSRWGLCSARHKNESSRYLFGEVFWAARIRQTKKAWCYTHW